MFASPGSVRLSGSFIDFRGGERMGARLRGLAGLFDFLGSAHLWACAQSAHRFLGTSQVALEAGACVCESRQSGLCVGETALRVTGLPLRLLERGMGRSNRRRATAYRHARVKTVIPQKRIYAGACRIETSQRLAVGLQAAERLRDFFDQRAGHGGQGVAERLGKRDFVKFAGQLWAAKPNEQFKQGLITRPQTKQCLVHGAAIVLAAREDLTVRTDELTEAGSTIRLPL